MAQTMQDKIAVLKSGEQTEFWAVLKESLEMAEAELTNDLACAGSGDRALRAAILFSANRTFIRLPSFLIQQMEHYLEQEKEAKRLDSLTSHTAEVPPTVGGDVA